MNRDARAPCSPRSARSTTAPGHGTSAPTAAGRSPGRAGSASSAAAPPPSTATTPSWARWANGSPSTGSQTSTPTCRHARRSGTPAANARCAPSSREAAARRARHASPPRANATDDETDQLIALATFVVRARSAVERDGYSREIELVPGPEAPTRLVDRARPAPRRPRRDRLRPRPTRSRVVTKAALDSVPALRLAVLDTLHADGRPRHQHDRRSSPPPRQHHHGAHSKTSPRTGSSTDAVARTRKPRTDGASPRSRAHVSTLFPKCRRTRGARDISAIPRY